MVATSSQLWEGGIPGRRARGEGSAPERELRRPGRLLTAITLPALLSPPVCISNFTHPASHPRLCTENNGRIFEFQTALGVGANLENQGD